MHLLYVRLNSNLLLLQCLLYRPGGMPPEMLKAMMSDEELVTMLRSPKMQEIVGIRIIS